MGQGLSATGGERRGGLAYWLNQPYPPFFGMCMLCGPGRVVAPLCASAFSSVLLGFFKLTLFRMVMRTRDGGQLWQRNRTYI